MKHQMGEFKIYSINNPLILSIDDIIPEELVDGLAQDIEEKCNFTKAKVATTTGKPADDIKRTNETSSIHYMQSDGARVFLDAASSVLRLHPAQAEPLSVIKYQKGQQFEAHLDAFQDDKIQHYTPQAGNRVATAILYLNDVLDGGETDFPKMGVCVPHKKGRCVFFSNTHMGTGQPLDLSTHAGLPVIRGEKMAVNLWFRSGVYDNNMYQKWLEKQNSL